MAKVDKKSVATGDGEKVEVLDIRGMARESRGWLERALGDVGKTSATKQLALGGVSGWCTGYLSMKVGKVAATALGGGLILLQVANHKGYIKINWNKVYGDVEKVTNKIQDEIGVETPTWIEKSSNYLEKKLDKAEAALKKGEKKVNRWYQHFVYGEGPFQLQEIHIFCAAFAAGVGLGIVCA